MMRHIVLILLSISLRTFAQDYDGGGEILNKPYCPINTTYGEDCDLKCHCREGDACIMNDGSCPNGCVGPHYVPPLCQDCTEGYFGQDCLPCHCLEGKSVCNTTTGSCSRGGCSIGYEGEACQTLTGSPRIESISVPLVVSVNESFLGSCSAEGAPVPNITMTSSNLTISDPGKIDNSTGTQTLVMYFISSLKGDFEIICEAFNEHGNTNWTEKVSVVDPPVLIDVPTFHGVQVSSINVSWSKWKHGHDIGGVDTDDIEYLVVYRPPGHPTWLDNGFDWHSETSAVIANLTPDSDYEIGVRCRRVRSENEGRLGPTAQWYTTCQSPSDTFVPYNFTAQVTSPSSARLSWLAPTRPDFVCPLQDFILKYDHPGTSPPNQVQHILKADQLEFNVSGLQPQSRYTFYIRATTSAGNNTKNAEFTIDPTKFVPGPVTDVKVQDVTATELHLTWSVPSDILPSEEKYINYTVTAILTSIGGCEFIPLNVSTFHTVYTENKQAVIDDVQPFSKYDVSVMARTVFGEHSQLVNLVADTPEAAPTAAVNNIRLLEQDSSKLGYEWDPLPCHTANGRLSYRYVLRRLDQSHRRRRRAPGDVVANGTTTGTNVTFDNLTPSTTYELAVSGATAAGEGPVSTTAKQTIEELRPPSVNATVMPKSILLQIIPPTNLKGKIKNYQLSVSSKDPNAKPQIINKTEGMLIHRVSDLTPNTDYTVKVRAETNSEWSDWSQDKIFRTKEDKPEAPVNLKVKPLNSTAIDVTWTNPAVSNGIITNYKLEVFGSTDAGVPDYTANVSYYEAANNYSTKVIVDHLGPGQVYFVEVSARTSAGYGDKATIKHKMDDSKDSGRSAMQRAPPPPSPSLVQINYLNDSVLTMDTIIYAVLPDFPNIPSYYEVVVYYRGNVSDIDLNETISIDDYEIAKRNKKSLWTAARILANEFPSGISSKPFVVGDNLTYHGFYNGPLSSDRLYTNYSVMLRFGEDKTFVSYLSSPMEIPPVAEAPVSVSITQLTSTSIEVVWEKPAVPNGVIIKYKVETFILHDNNEKEFDQEYETTNGSTTKAEFEDLSYEIVYIVEVAAKTKVGLGKTKSATITMKNSDITPTILVKIPPPPVPTLVEKIESGSTMSLNITLHALPQSSSYIISYYEVIVVRHDKRSDEINLNETVIDGYNSTRRDELKPWVAARIPSGELPAGSSMQFIVGDGKTYDGYANGPLSSTQLYAVMLRGGDGIQSGSYLSPPMEIPPVAEAPVSVSLFQLNSTSIEVVWEKPEVANGVIINYRVDIFNIGDEDKIIELYETANGTTTIAILNDLSVGIEYLVKVAARTNVGLGKTQSANITMKIPGRSPERQISSMLPSPPVPTLVEKIESGSTMSLNVTLYALPERTRFNIDYYEVIVVRHEKSSDEIDLNGTSIINEYDSTRRDELKPWVAARIPSRFLPFGDSMQFIVGDGGNYDTYYNGPLSSTQLYAVMLRVGRGYDSVSRLSSPMKSELNTGPGSEDVGKTCMIWGISCVLFMVLVITAVIIFWIIVAICVLCRRNRRRKKLSITGGKLNNSGHPDNIWPKGTPDVDIANDTVLTVFPSNQGGSSKTFNKNCNFFGPIPVRDLSEYISQRDCNPKIDFQEEFKQAIRDKTKPWTVAKKPENLKKNRYGNILPYDMTRVRLEPYPGQPDTDYINASFIDGYDKPKVYIATQGPKENTFQDFWRMVWQENVAVVVMLTGLTENKKKKCDQYWPNHSRLYGNLLVTLTTTEHLADLVIRHFELKTVEAAEIRDVTHYQYLDWPDLGLPPCVTSVLNLRRKVREEMQKRVSRSPIVVHCCGGAGRTGAFIAIDAMLNQAYEEERVHVFKYVGVIWGNRSNLIQNVEQYRFVYNAVLEALQSGDTKVLCSRLPVYYRDICRTSANEPADLAEQFNILNRLERRQSCYACPDALNDENTRKNRSNEILPVEHSRVRLQSIYEPVFEEDESREDCIPARSDPYINAVLCDGFKQKGQFLVTHMPLDDTVQDFWRMVVLNRSSVIVMLNDCEFIDENTVPGQYWPNEGCMQFGPYQVEVVTFEELGMVTLRTLRVVDTRKINEFNPLRVSQLQFLDWVPDKAIPSSVVSVLALINVADVLRNKYGGPLTVHCQDGASRCGVFCASHVLKEQVETGEVDIFQTVKRLRRHRPQFITSIEQYQFCYEVAMASLSTADNSKDSSRLITLV